MSTQVDLALRAPQAYGLARQALERMEQDGIWPTPLNYELWVHYVGHPGGALALEIQRLLASGTRITEDISEALAADFLPKARLQEQIRDAGAQLSKELTTVADAIRQAQTNTARYGEALLGAERSLEADSDAGAIRATIAGLTVATEEVRRENATLEVRLAESVAEVSRLKQHLEQVRRDATTDALTGLANRKAFDEELQRTHAEATSGGQPLTVAVLDIDHFKQFNDTWGHQTGDQVLRYVASVIGRVGSSPRFAARYGGEEFAVICPGETAQAVCESLEGVRVEVSSRILKRRSTNEDLGAVTLSAGIAQLDRGESIDAVVERADAALYASKRAGRNRVTVADPAPAGAQAA